VAKGKVVGLGLSVLDEAYLVDDFEIHAVRTRFHARRVAPGGMVSNAIVQAAELGVAGHLLTMLGNDADGDFIAKQLRSHGVVTRGVVRSKTQPTTVSVVLVDRRSKDRRFLVPDRRKIEAQCPDFDLSSINSSTILLVDGHFPKQAMRAVRRARECGAVVVADFHTPRPGCMKLLPFVDYPIVSSEFGTAWQNRSPRQTLRMLHEQYGGNPVVTLGEKGAVGLVEGRLTDIPAARVSVRDTTGAGDAFHGAFAAGLCLGYSAEQSLHLASRAAAACCTEFGATARPLRSNEISVRPAGRARK
jgi:sulfofructose kinase